jgi:hypothetical protein
MAVPPWSERTVPTDVQVLDTRVAFGRVATKGGASVSVEAIIPGEGGKLARETIS